METRYETVELPDASLTFAARSEAAGAIPIFAVREGQALGDVSEMNDAQRAWAHANAFTGKAKQWLLVPRADGGVASVLLGFGAGQAGEPCGPSELLLGAISHKLPGGTYRLASGFDDQTAASIGWMLGAYRFDRYKAGEKTARARLAVPEDVDAHAVASIASAIWFGRDLINTPANDMGPEQLERAGRVLAKTHGAACAVITGEALRAQNFPMIHAVGRASCRAPRLIDLVWGREGARRVTLVGKGVCFDTGGLDIKPASGMLLMKKDMGGAAAAFSLAHMIMSAGLDVRLRVLVPAVENAVSASAFRPGDVLDTRAGTSVEIGNTDAEGRLVLADALTLGDSERPDLMVSFATLTGAARVALGPDLPPMFVDDDDLAARIAEAGMRVGDPVWRMPFWPGYDPLLKSAVADINNISNGPFGGAITAALFLKRFVREARHYAHFDIYGWRPGAHPLGPKGGEPHASRAMFDVISRIAAEPVVS